MAPPGRVTLVLGGTLLCVALAAGLEGGVVAGLGGPVVALAAGVGAAAARPERSGRLTTVGFLLVALAILWSVIPVPEAVRAVVAPGQARWLALTAPEWEGSLSGWLAALTRYDVAAAVGAPGAFGYDVLAGAEASVLRPGGLAGDRAPWVLAQLGGMVLLYRAGVAIGRSEPHAVRFLAGILLFCVAEALFGLANRNGPSTGIGAKVYYLGSATGTFVNRGHFGAFLALGLAAAWGLAAGLFPLESDEVRRHRQRRNRSSHPPGILEAAGDRVPRLVLLALGAGLVGVGMVASQARGPLLGFGLAAVIVGGLALRWRGERFHLGIGLGVPAAVGIVSLVGFGVRGAFGRFGELATGGGESLSSRLAVWRAGLAGVADAPVFGGGPGSWRRVWTLHEAGPHLYDFQHAHDEVVEQLVELGVVGTAGLALLLVAWALRCAGGLRAAPHDPRTAAGVGALVGTTAVLIQSLGDFPLHAPGVGLATAACAGLARGALTEREGDAPRWRWGLLAAGTIALAGVAAWQDLALDVPRSQRVGELPRVWHTLAGEAPDVATARQRREQVYAATEATPLDPWAQVLLAQEEARLAWFAGRGVGRTEGAVEDHTFAAERALSRALRLRPQDGRLDLAAARVMVVLAKAGSAPDAWNARATERLAQAVRLDPWRAAEAFELAGSLSDEALVAIAAGAPSEGAPAARVRYELGQALARRGELAAAVAAFRAALEADPGYGPAWFQLGVQLRARGEADAAAEAFRSFLAARERPGGMEGWAELFLGNLDAAEDRLRRIVTTTPTNRWAWEGLAEVAARRHDRASELEAWRRIQALAPGDARAAARVKDLEAAGP